MAIWNNNECFQKKCITSLDLCDETLQNLKTHVCVQRFTSLKDEIQFFKEVKPKILSVKFACRELMEYDLERAIDQEKDIADLQRLYLNKMQGKFNHFKDFRFYVQSEMSNRDELYFTLGNLKDDYILRLIPEVEIDFSTGYDILMAYSLASDFLKNHFEEVRPSTKQVYYPELQWTGNKTDLVELLACLHRTSVFNNGENDFKRFALIFSQMVNFEIKDVYRTVSAIKDRKKEKKSFLNRMLSAFQEMISDAHK
jgi:hypothetical protein